MESPGTIDVLPPPSDRIPPGVVPMRAEDFPPNRRMPMARPGLASIGQPITLLTNHFRVSASNIDDYFYHYNVSLKYEDNNPAYGTKIGRRVIDKLQQLYGSELGNKDFAYDGQKSLFTIGALPRANNEFTVGLEDKTPIRAGGSGGNDSPGASDRKRLQRLYQMKIFKVELKFAAKISMQSIAMALRGRDTENSQDALRVLDIILRQNAAKRGCLLVRKSFFQNNPSNFTQIGGGLLGCRGFHSSFQTTQDGLSLNVDLSTTVVVQPGPVVDFLIANQDVRNRYHIDWAKAKRTLKNLMVKASPSNLEFKITGLSELPCNQQKFMLKQSSGGNGDDIQITVYEYFVKHRNIELRYSADLPCLNVGKPKRPTYFPIELCALVSLQRYTKQLTNLQRASLVEKSRQKPNERMGVITRALKNNNYDADPMLRACGISINSHITRVDGRVLPAPKLKVGNGDSLTPMKGRWNFNNKKLIEPCTVDQWAVVNFSARCDIRNLIGDLTKCGRSKGIYIAQPLDVFEENPSMRRAPPDARVEEMFKRIGERLHRFLLCLLPERKNCDVYGPWKRKCLVELGIVTQCMAPTRINDQYLTNILLKINAKLGGVNSLLQVEYSPCIPLISKIPTIIFGMDVSHGPPGQSDVPSIAAVVSSRQWPGISRYRASVQTQPARFEMIENLFKPLQENNDEGIIRELLIDFYASSAKRKPEQIIIFRDGVGESQFNQVLNIELERIIEACKCLDEGWFPKFTVIIAQKNHHTRFFQANNPQENVPPGTVVDNNVCHPRNYDFYMCSHAGMIGTTRPTHYHVLHDEIGLSADDMQQLVHSLCYVYQRSTAAISVVAPIRYARLAATQLAQFIKFEDMSTTSLSRGGFTSAGSSSVPELPRLHENVRSSMFFC